MTMNKKLTAFVGAKIAEFRAKMADVSAIMKKTATGAEVNVDADTKRFSAKYAEIKAKLATFKKATTVTIKAKWNNLNKRFDEIGDKMDDLAKGIRTFGTIAQSSMTGFAMSISTAGVPAIASLIAGIGALGPMVGVAAGGAAAMGASYALAGAGIASFTAVAKANLGDMFEKMKKMSDLQSKIDMTKDLKARNKLLQQQKAILDSMDKPERRAYEASQKLKQVWTGITDPLKSQTVNIYTKALSALSTVLTMLKPTFQGATQAVDNLVDSLNKALKTSDAINFFKTLGETVGPSLETMTKAGMNFMLGLMNLFTAFVPLGMKMQNGFLGMSQAFLKWTETASKSTAFQNFINYVMTNGPKLLQIIGNLSLGIIGMFSAFGSTSADMMTSLVNMTNSFKTWGQTLGQNEQFQQFIAYVKANAPAVIALIGNVVQIIGSLAVGFAPVGAAVLKFLVPFTQMVGSFLQAHPAVASFIAVIVTVLGLLIAIAPQVIALTTLFTGFGGTIVKVGGMIISAFLPAGVTAGTAFKTMGQAALSSAKNIGIAMINGIKSLGSMVASAAIATGQFIASMAKMAASAIAKGAQIVAQWLVMAAQATANAVRVAAAWTLSTGAAMATAVAKMITSAAVFVARWVFMGAQALVQAARMAAAWFIALGPIGWVTATVIAIAALIIANWSKIKSWTISAFGAISSFLSGIWSGIKSFVSGAVNGMRNGISNAWNSIKSATGSAFRAVVGFIKNPLKAINLFSIGKNIIQGLINGIGSLASAVGSKIMSIAGNIKNKIQGALGIHSPSRFMAWIGQMTGQGLVNGISGMQRKVASASQGMAQAAQIAPQQTDFSYSSQVSAGGLDSVQQEVTASMEQTELSKKPANIYVQVGSKTLAKAIIDDVNRLQDKQVSSRAVYS
jgi:phage-related protein